MLLKIYEKKIFTIREQLEALQRCQEIFQIAKLINTDPINILERFYF